MYRESKMSPFGMYKYNIQVLIPKKEYPDIRDEIADALNCTRLYTGRLIHATDDEKKAFKSDHLVKIVEILRRRGYDYSVTDLLNDYSSNEALKSMPYVNQLEEE